MKKFVVIIVCFFIFSVVFFTACTQQERAKQYGGKLIIELPAGQKLTMATWKNNHLWYMTRPKRPGEIIEVYSFKESSSFGVLEGEIIFKEH